MSRSTLIDISEFVSTTPGWDDFAWGGDTVPGQEGNPFFTFDPKLSASSVTGAQVFAGQNIPPARPFDLESWPLGLLDDNTISGVGSHGTPAPAVAVSTLVDDQEPLAFPLSPLPAVTGPNNQPRSGAFHDDYSHLGTPKRFQFKNLLPADSGKGQARTGKDLLNNLLENTVDRYLTPPDHETTAGFIGASSNRPFDPLTGQIFEHFINESSLYRQENQLQVAAFSDVNGKHSNTSWQELLDRMRILGLDTEDRTDCLFATYRFSYQPPINPDMFLFNESYIWTDYAKKASASNKEPLNSISTSAGANFIPVSISTGTTTITASGSPFDFNDILGRSDQIRLRGQTLTISSVVSSTILELSESYTGSTLVDVPLSVKKPVYYVQGDSAFGASNGWVFNNKWTHEGDLNDAETSLFSEGTFPRAQIPIIEVESDVIIAGVFDAAVPPQVVMWPVTYLDPDNIALPTNVEFNSGLGSFDTGGFEFEFDVKIGITAASAGAGGAFFVASDVTAIFSSGYVFNVLSSENNDGAYTVDGSTTFDSSSLQSRIPTVEAIPTASAGGLILSVSTTSLPFDQEVNTSERRDGIIPTFVKPVLEYFVDEVHLDGQATTIDPFLDIRAQKDTASGINYVFRNGLVDDSFDDVPRDQRLLVYATQISDGEYQFRSMWQPTKTKITAPELNSEGDWETAENFRNNVQKDNPRLLTRLDIEDHLDDIMRTNSVGTNLLNGRNWRDLPDRSLGQGGKIFQYEHNLDWWISLMFQEDSDPATVLAFARDEHFRRNNAIRGIIQRLANDLSDIGEVITQSQFRALVLEEFRTLLDGIVPSAFEDSSNGIPNFIATPAHFGLCLATIPGFIYDHLNQRLAYRGVLGEIIDLPFGTTRPNSLDIIYNDIQTFVYESVPSRFREESRTETTTDDRLGVWDLEALYIFDGDGSTGEFTLPVQIEDGSEGTIKVVSEPSDYRWVNATIDFSSPVASGDFFTLELNGKMFSVSAASAQLPSQTASTLIVDMKYAITDVNPTQKVITVDGDRRRGFAVGDSAEILNSTDNDAVYEILGIGINASSNTEITLFSDTQLDAIVDGSITGIPEITIIRSFDSLKLQQVPTLGSSFSVAIVASAGTIEEIEPNPISPVNASTFAGSIIFAATAWTTTASTITVQEEPNPIGGSTLIDGQDYILLSDKRTLGFNINNIPASGLNNLAIVHFAWSKRYDSELPPAFRFNIQPGELVFDINNYIAGSPDDQNEIVCYAPEDITSEEEIRFLKWAQRRDGGFVQRFSEPFTNIQDAGDPFSWNYKDVDARIPAYWYQIYEEFFGTSGPQYEPWIVQGYAQKPGWWEIDFPRNDSGLYPYRDMWQRVQDGDLQIGHLGIGELDGDVVTPQNNLPIDFDTGELLAPYSSNFNSVFDTIPSSRFDDFVFGDNAPAEAQWRCTLDFQWDRVEIGYKLKPIDFISLAWDAGRVKFWLDNYTLDSHNGRKTDHKTMVFHGEDEECIETERDWSEYFFCGDGTTLAFTGVSYTFSPIEIFEGNGQRTEFPLERARFEGDFSLVSVAGSTLVEGSLVAGSVTGGEYAFSADGDTLIIQPAAGAGQILIGAEWDTSIDASSTAPIVGLLRASSATASSFASSTAVHFPTSTFHVSGSATDGREITEVTITSSAGTLNASGAADYWQLHSPNASEFYVWYNVTGGSGTSLDPGLGVLPEIFEVTMPADATGWAASAAAAAHWQLFLPGSTSASTDFYVWYSVASAATDPGASGTGIQVVGVASADLSGSIATKTASAINADGSFIATASAGVVTVQATIAGSTLDAVDVDASVSFVITQEGSFASGTGIQVNITDISTSAFIAQATASVINAAAGALQQVTTVTIPTSGGANFLASGVGDYWQLFTPEQDGRQDYYVWYDVASSFQSSASSGFEASAYSFNRGTPDSIARSDGNWLASAGNASNVVAGDRIRVTGTSFNNGVFTVAVAGSQLLVLTTDNGLTGEVISASAGASTVMLRGSNTDPAASGIGLMVIVDPTGAASTIAAQTASVINVFTPVAAVAASDIITLTHETFGSAQDATDVNASVAIVVTINGSNGNWIAVTSDNFITITNTATGSSVDAVDASTGFTISTLRQGPQTFSTTWNFGKSALAFGASNAQLFASGVLQASASYTVVNSSNIYFSASDATLVDLRSGAFVITGDAADDFLAGIFGASSDNGGGVAFEVITSTGNDGTYIVGPVNAVYNASTNTTVIPVLEPVPDPTVDGTIVYSADITDYPWDVAGWDDQWVGSSVEIRSKLGSPASTLFFEPTNTFEAYVNGIQVNSENFELNACLQTVTFASDAVPGDFELVRFFTYNPLAVREKENVRVAPKIINGVNQWYTQFYESRGRGVSLGTDYDLFWKNWDPRIIYRTNNILNKDSVLIQNVTGALFERDTDFFSEIDRTEGADDFFLDTLTISIIEKSETSFDNGGFAPQSTIYEVDNFDPRRNVVKTATARQDATYNFLGVSTLSTSAIAAGSTMVFSGSDTNGSVLSFRSRDEISVVANASVFVENFVNVREQKVSVAGSGATALAALGSTVNIKILVEVPSRVVNSQSTDKEFIENTLLVDDLVANTFTKGTVESTPYPRSLEFEADENENLAIQDIILPARFVGASAVFNFLGEYERYLLEKGGVFDFPRPSGDEDTGEFNDWVLQRKRFIRFVDRQELYFAANATKPDSIVLNPIDVIARLGTETGLVAPLESQADNFSRRTQAILDVNGFLVGPRKTQVMRGDDITTIEVIEGSTTRLFYRNQIPFTPRFIQSVDPLEEGKLVFEGEIWFDTINELFFSYHLADNSFIPVGEADSGVYSFVIEPLELYTVHWVKDNYEHIIRFENETSTGLTIYNPLTGDNITRMYVQFERSRIHKGRPNLGGFVLTRDGFDNLIITRNIEAQVQGLKYLYDQYKVPIDNNFEFSIPKLLGHDRADYLDPLLGGQSIRTKTGFMKGFIQQKGARDNIQSFIKGVNTLRSFELEELFAYKVAEYGTSKDDDYVKILVSEREGSRNLLGLQFADASRLEERDPNVIQIVENDADRFVDQIDQDTTVDTFRFYFPALLEESILPRWEVDHTQTVLGQSENTFTPISESGSATVAASLAFDADSTTSWIGSTITAGSSFLGADFGTVGPGGFEEKAKIASMTLVQGASFVASEIQVQYSLTEGSLATLTWTDLGDPVSLVGAVGSNEKINLPLHSISARWWRVVPTEISASNWEIASLQMHTYRHLPDYEKIGRVTAWNTKTSGKVASWYPWDPAEGIHPPSVHRYVDHELLSDPALFTHTGTNTANRNDPDNAWGEEKVGEVWWDTSLYGTIDYKDERELTTSIQRANAWGRLKAGKKVALYEWVKSEITPSAWQDEVEEGTVDGDPRNLTDYSRDIIALPDGSQKIYYYFWVGNRAQASNDKSGNLRDLSIQQIALGLEHPNNISDNKYFFSDTFKPEGVSTGESGWDGAGWDDSGWDLDVSIIPDRFIKWFGNRADLIFTSDNIQLLFERHFPLSGNLEGDDLLATHHTEWELIRRGQTKLPPTALWDEMVETAKNAQCQLNPGTDQAIYNNDCMMDQIDLLELLNRRIIEILPGFFPEGYESSPPTGAGNPTFESGTPYDGTLSPVVATSSIDPLRDLKALGAPLQVFLTPDDPITTSVMLSRDSDESFWSVACTGQVVELMFDVIESAMASDTERQDLFKTSWVAYDVQKELAQTLFFINDDDDINLALKFLEDGGKPFHTQIKSDFSVVTYTVSEGLNVNISDSALLAIGADLPGGSGLFLTDSFTVAVADAFAPFNIKLLPDDPFTATFAPEGGFGSGLNLIQACILFEPSEELNVAILDEFAPLAISIFVPTASDALGTETIDASISELLRIDVCHEDPDGPNTYGFYMLSTGQWQMEGVPVIGGTQIFNSAANPGAEVYVIGGSTSPITAAFSGGDSWNFASTTTPLSASNGQFFVDGIFIDNSKFVIVDGSNVSIPITGILPLASPAAAVTMRTGNMLIGAPEGISGGGGSDPITETWFRHDGISLESAGTGYDWDGVGAETASSITSAAQFIRSVPRASCA